MAHRWRREEERRGFWALEALAPEDVGPTCGNFLLLPKKSNVFDMNKSILKGSAVAGDPTSSMYVRLRGASLGMSFFLRGSQTSLELVFLSSVCAAFFCRVSLSLLSLSLSPLSSVAAAFWLVNRAPLALPSTMKPCDEGHAMKAMNDHEGDEVSCLGPGYGAWVPGPRPSG